jgi:tetratricopeptide (TPR) repeat protein
VRWTERAVAHAEHADPSRRALVLVAAGMAHYNAERDERWLHCLEEAVDIFRSLREPLGIAWSLRWLGHYLRAADPSRARSCFEEALAIFRDLGNKTGTAWCLFVLAGLADDRGEADPADGMRRQALELSRDVPSARGPILSDLAVSAAGRGDLATAVARAREAVAASRTVGSRWNQSMALMAAAGVELQAGHHEAGGVYVRDALTLWRQYGSRELLACSLIIAAHYMLDDGDPDAAQTLLSATGWDDVGPDYPYVRGSLTHVRAGLAGLALDEAANRGRALGLDGAVDEALERLTIDGVPTLDAER